MMTLYYAANTCALASHIALEESGADYKTIRLDFDKEDQRKPQYLAINPKGRVPALVCEDGVLTENPAILSYIAQSYPAAQLAPLDSPFAFAKVQAFNMYIASTLHVAHAHGKRGARWADDPAAIAEMERKMPEAVLQGFELVENDMFIGPYVMGDKYTICDPYLFTIARWMEHDGVDPDLLPKIRNHRLTMSKRPSVQKVLAKEAEDDDVGLFTG
jgi:glutathione S-transferase